MTNCGSYIGPRFPNIYIYLYVYIKVDGGICKYIKVFEGIWMYLNVYKDALGPAL